jgi:competence protein ComEC
MVTGLSPSVLRAATMFSNVAIGNSFSKSGNIYNSLGIAAFLLLLFDPYLIYSVGFQLSFAAVFGIVYIQPKLYRMLEFKNQLIDYAWSITCVSIAAQLATLPISLYYFHQFPTYFLLSNILVIPAASVILSAGLAMLIADPMIPWLGDLLGALLSYFMKGVNLCISSIELLPNHLITWIYFDQIMVVLAYLFFILFFIDLSRKTRILAVPTIIFICFWIWFIFLNVNQTAAEKVIFYSTGADLVIDHVKGHHVVTYSTADEPERYAFNMNPYRMASFLPPISETDAFRLPNDKALNTIVIGGKKVLLFDSVTFHLNFFQKLTADWIVIQNEAVKNLEWLHDHFDCDMVILASTNDRRYTSSMLTKADELGIAMHSLSENGALSVDIKKERAIKPALFTTNPD